MKRIITISTIILFIGASCGGNKQSTVDLITVDVTASYPEKELILQDFMDVEYIVLETTDEFITKGVVEAIGKDILLTTNRNNDGDIFVFDRTGKGLSKINHFGQGAEEYSQMTEIILDEDNNEMFVVAYSARKILVYDLYGTFKRSFKFADTSYYTNTFNYDREHLICYKSYQTLIENEQACHILVSKQDGSITREIRIPFKEVETPVVTKDELTVTPEFYLTFPNQGSWALVNTSSDTVYNYLPDGNLIPFIVRTPSIHSMDPEVFLFPGILTDRYSFMRAMKKELNFTTFKGFPSTDLVYDKQKNTLFQYTLCNNDFSDKKQVYLGLKPVNQEIVAGLHEESNPVIMLAKYKK